MRLKAARATAQIAVQSLHSPPGPALNGGSVQHACDQEVILQRTGLRPLRFTGALIASSDRSFAPYRARIRLALYWDLQRDFVAAWSCVDTTAGDENLSCHGGDRCTTLHAAITAFEDAGPEFPLEGLAPDSGISATLQHAADGVMRDMAIRTAFDCAVGMFLYELCMAGETSFDDV
jgi:hypothetical protein